MWEYVKGSEADFEGVSDIAVMILRDKDTMLYYVKSADPDQKQKIYCFSLGSYNTHNRSLSWWSSLSGDSTINTYFSTDRYEVIAERRKVDNLQSRINDSNLTEALIAERGTRYGEFKDGAAIMQQLKDMMKGAPKWEALKPSQKEALEMIQHKIGRILNGDPDYDDNWKDIAGYATLIVKELSK